MFIYAQTEPRNYHTRTQRFIENVQS